MCVLPALRTQHLADIRALEARYDDIAQERETEKERMLLAQVSCLESALLAAQAVTSNLETTVHVAVQTLLSQPSKQRSVAFGSVQVDDDGFPHAGQSGISDKMKPNDPDHHLINTYIQGRKSELLVLGMCESDAYRAALRDFWVHTPKHIDFKSLAANGVKSRTMRPYTSPLWCKGQILLATGAGRPVPIEVGDVTTVGFEDLHSNTALRDTVLREEGLPPYPHGLILLRRILTMFYKKDFQGVTHGWACDQHAFTSLSFDRVVTHR